MQAVTEFDAVLDSVTRFHAMYVLLQTLGYVYVSLNFVEIDRHGFVSKQNHQVFQESCPNEQSLLAKHGYFETFCLAVDRGCLRRP